MERGQQNGLRGLRWLPADELRELEPNVAGVAALHVPEEGVVDYAVVCRRLADVVSGNGGEIRYGAPVRHLRREGSLWQVDSDAGACTARFLLNCAGLQADRVAALAGQPSDVRIVPFRGSYYALRPERSGLVRHLVYPVPNPAFPFLGVHFTRDVYGRVHVGPNASLALARQRYAAGAIDVRDAAAVLAFPGLWRFISHHPRRCFDELAQSLSRRRFVQAARRLVPDVRTDDLVPGRAGIRAQAMDRTGGLVMDFLLVDGPDALHLLNVPSPGATAALAVADEVARRVLDRLGLGPQRPAAPPCAGEAVAR
jgi:L-2-hydroxyglutarate oxidase